MNWLRYFELNRKRRQQIPWEQGATVPESQRGPLVRSLQRFQLGERSEGTCLLRYADATGDAEYAACARLFTAEEQYHAGLMRNAIVLLGGHTIKRHWSSAAFLVVRRLMGLNVELAVFLTAEMVGLHYFTMLRDGLRDPVLRVVFAQIAADEEGHLAFHADRLRRAVVRAPRVIRRVLFGAFRSLYEVVALVVLFDHRRLLQALGVTAGGFMRGADGIFDRVIPRVFVVTAEPARRGEDRDIRTIRL